MLRLYNTLTRRLEVFSPWEPGVVRMYTCGPTVYRYAHLGNLRSYLMADWLRRALTLQGYRVIHVKNITDVGHMRQELLERGEDKMIAAALAEGKSPQEIAAFYTEAFHRDEAKLNILPAHYFPRATDHIPEMIRLIQRLLEKGLAYERQGNVYFQVSRFPRYGCLSGNIGQDLLHGVRSELDPLKKDPRDFTLWKAAEPDRLLKWPSPWGEGFPGWHIECSAMAMKYLGEQLDIHTGGVDNVFPHHEAEIAQSEGATGKPFVRFWVHGQHLLADGVKMAKSAANDFTLADLEERGFDPLAFRYLCLTAHYSNRLNFTFTALRAAQKALLGLQNRVWQWSLRTSPASEDTPEALEWRRRFWERVNHNLNLPGALAVTWQMVASSLPDSVKLKLLLEFDALFGLGLEQVPQRYQVPASIMEIAVRRAELREQELYPEADTIRQRLHAEGYLVEDTREGSRIRPMSRWESHQARWRWISSPREVASLLEAPDTVSFSVNVVIYDHLEDAQRCLKSVLAWQGAHSLEVVVVDNGAPDTVREWLEGLERREPRVRVLHTDHTLGEGAAKNIALKQSQGKYIVVLDTSAELKGDIFAPIERLLSEPRVGMVGPWGLATTDLRHFHEVYQGEADAMQMYCMAFPRRLLMETGLLRESFRFYRMLDVDFSFRVKDRGYRILAVPLPMERHQHRLWERLSPEEREKMSKKNFYRFLKTWGQRYDLLVQKVPARG